MLLLKDLSGLVRMESLEQVEQGLRLEGLHVVVRALATVSAEGDDGELGLQLFEPPDELGAGYVGYGDIEDGAVDARELFERFDRLSTAVRRDYVELGGLDDELAGGDGTGVFAIHDEETGSQHLE